jgi:hypothetical protein
MAQRIMVDACGSARDPDADRRCKSPMMLAKKVSRDGAVPRFGHSYLGVRLESTADGPSNAGDAAQVLA